ncbi:hypothetical protein F5Y06DRAFT_305467 [Hypoxylon sp. FL0890]|nr:hypothetical protein F5Y06DRAFT_305467 [Hypoxylon sp. FL0890]
MELGQGTAKLYSDAANTKFRLPDDPKWWFNTDKAAEYYNNTKSTISVALHKEASKVARYIAIDAIRFARDEWRSLSGCNWKQVESSKPVLFVSCSRDSDPPLWARGRTIVRPTYALGALLGQFYSEIFTFIPPNYQCWGMHFYGFGVGEKLRVLESIPFLMPQKEISIDQHICIIAGIDTVYNRDTHDEIRRLLRVIKKLLVDSGKAKILLVCRATFNVAHVLDCRSSFVDIDEEVCLEQKPKVSTAAYLPTWRRRRNSDH